MQGECTVEVEFRGADSTGFGHGQKTEMAFGAFLDRISEGDTSLYLTPQEVRCMLALLSVICQIRELGAFASASCCPGHAIGSALHTNLRGARCCCTASVPGLIMCPASVTQQLRAHCLSVQPAWDEEHRVPKVVSQLLERLQQDFPVMPEVLGNLVPHQVNLWIGAAPEGMSRPVQFASAQCISAHRMLAFGHVIGVCHT